MLLMQSYNSCRAICYLYLYISFLLHINHTLNPVESRKLFKCRFAITKKVQYQWSNGNDVCAWLALWCVTACAARGRMYTQSKLVFRVIQPSESHRNFFSSPLWFNKTKKPKKKPQPFHPCCYITCIIVISE